MPDLVADYVALRNVDEEPILTIEGLALFLGRSKKTIGRLEEAQPSLVSR